MSTDTAPTASFIDASQNPKARPRAIGFWLVAVAFMVFAMMIIGAITRLTESGLSMVEWRPLMGFLPPISTTEWERVFALYKQTSQYAMMNQGMTLDAFQHIFFWEWFHRLWGRLIGVVFAVPFFYFLIRGQIPKGYTGHFWALLFLGGLQGVIGMWMVKSGFVDRVEVSQYRLAMHLGIAFFILGYTVWLALGLLLPIEENRKPAPRPFRRLGAWAHGVIFITILSGALVAGLNAGFIYNEWPTMGGQFIPDGYWDEALGFASLFETLEAVQFNHRILAYITVITVLGLFWWSRRMTLPRRTKAAIHALFAMVCVQVCLGIATLLSIVWLPLAVMHQAGAAMTFCLALWCLKELRGGKDVPATAQKP
ncbi:MAG TPA: heme A synthase [Rhodospirillaceae bacterium]|nr:heme A synthase [Rhodospirillaceae bacterium]MBB59341.1 heme A synthase [Rhodospirillaceae bacterium]HAE00416.1 heme A synthase [Rhodospirillaceae bacterium]HBM11749.1 heme A synthase [Rhodospirillaceae bacterium]|tara:strand:+ start:25628 stop:26731 length:1104 start_codon:yes stop_codon:yes gene_type:complete